MVELPPLADGQHARVSPVAGALNERDELVGDVVVGGVYRAVLWRDGGVVDLGTLSARAPTRGASAGRGRGS